MSSQTSSNFHLTSNQRYLIEFMLSQQCTPQEIVEQWNKEFHNRNSPSIQTIDKIKKLVDNGESSEPLKKGPTKRSVLTEDKLEEIKKVIDENPFITNKSLSNIVNTAQSTVNDGIHLLQYKHYKAVPSPFLSEEQKIQRLYFCQTFLCWNQQYQMRVWWSDESTFKVEQLVKFVDRGYYAQENLHLKIVKKKRQNSVNVWAAIRGDGKVVYEILEGRQNHQKYIQMLGRKFHEMEPRTSFLMQDGSRHHYARGAIQWLNSNWNGRWIGLGSDRIDFPPHSMD